ncbi:MAG TPA: class I SAM-dependent methyltransferase [Acidobacteriota bacterium]|nr:class I SAM-dependent methyltransferase [Acidobacteriota bacterium]
MGLTRMGPPEELVLLIRDHSGVSTFVETGTFYGNTAFWASTKFKKVITIERSEIVFKKATETYGHVQNIEFRQGDSVAELAQLVPTLKEPAIFWLDSHWSGGETYGKEDECPLLQELKSFQPASCKHVLMIDDARLFSSPPPLPHRKEQWPTLMQLMERLKTLYENPYVVLFEDVFICVPPELFELVSDYCQKQNTQFWKARGAKLEQQPEEGGFFKKVLGKAKKKMFSEPLPDLSRNYMDPDIPAKQRRLVDEQLAKMYQGDVAPHFKVLVDVFSKIKNGGSALRVLDAGCASAYYSEILKHLVSRPLQYVGSDFNSKMLEMAHQKYPGLPFFRMDLRKLAWQDSSFDVVLSGAVIVHIKEWQEAVAEIARVAKKWLILHRTRVRLGAETLIKPEVHYDVDVYRVSIGEKELLDHLNTLNFKLESKIECYEGELEEGFGNFTYLFARQEHS